MKLNEAKKVLQKHKKILLNLGVKELALFGSVARNESSPKSDIDVLVQFDARKGLFAFIGVRYYLEDILECKVDLVSKDALHPALKEKILIESKHVF